MVNWNTDEQQLRQKHPDAYRTWRMVQLINYGLEGETLDTAYLTTHWGEIKDQILPNRRKTLEWLLWQKPWVNQSV